MSGWNVHFSRELNLPHSSTTRATLPSILKECFRNMFPIVSENGECAATLPNRGWVHTHMRRACACIYAYTHLLQHCAHLTSIASAYMTRKWTFIWQHMLLGITHRCILCQMAMCLSRGGNAQLKIEHILYLITHASGQTYSHNHVVRAAIFRKYCHVLL